MKTRTRIIIGSILLIFAIGTLIVTVFPLKMAVVESDKLTKNASSSTFKIVNVNTAEVRELEKLPNIGPSKAKAIVDYREEFGAFKSPEELLNVPGIGKSTLDKISNLVTGFSTSYTLTESVKLNINKATAKEIENLPSIGSVKAREIVSYREAHGSFCTFDDLTKVKGIGPKTVEKIRDLIDF